VTSRATTCSGRSVPCQTNAGAQQRSAVDDRLPRAGQQLRLADPVEHEGRLLEVQALVGLGQAVEHHAGLHRGERVDVLDGAAVSGEPVDRRLVQAREREVRGGTATRAG